MSANSRIIIFGIFESKKFDSLVYSNVNFNLTVKLRKSPKKIIENSENIFR